MSIYTLIPIVFIALYLGYWFYIKNKNSQQAQIVSNTDFKAEFANAEKYKNHFLTSELPFLKKAMEQEKIDAFSYASNEYGVASALKDGVKDKLKGIEVVVYEPVLQEDEFFNSRVIKDLKEFKKISDVIVANRISEDIKDVLEKIYTRDIFNSDS